MPRTLKLSYLKCIQCRRDKQKCLPLSRSWPQRCDRCIKYDYDCSSNKSANEDRKVARRDHSLNTSCLPSSRSEIVHDKLLKKMRHCIENISSWKYVHNYWNTLLASLYHHWIHDDPRINRVRSFLQRKAEFFEKACLTAEELLTTRHFSEAAILFEVASDSIPTGFRYADCQDLSSLKNYITLSEGLGDYWSALKLQERLIELMDEEEHEERTFAVSKFWQMSRDFTRPNKSTVQQPGEENNTGIVDITLSIPAVHQALMTRKKSVLLEIIKNPDWRHAEHFAGYSALEVATVLNDMEAIKVLLHAGANIDEQNWRGRTCIHIAAKLRHPDALRVLCQAGADVNITDTHGFTALHFAIRRLPSSETLGSGNQKLTEIVQILCQYGANVNATTNSGCIPLHYALSEDFDKIMEMILQAVISGPQTF